MSRGYEPQYPNSACSPRYSLDSPAHFPCDLSDAPCPPNMDIGSPQPRTAGTKTPSLSSPRPKTWSPTLKSARVTLSPCLRNEVLSSTVMVWVTPSGRKIVSCTPFMALISPTMKRFPNASRNSASPVLLDRFDTDSACHWLSPKLWPRTNPASPTLKSLNLAG